MPKTTAQLLEPIELHLQQAPELSPRVVAFPTERSRPAPPAKLAEKIVEEAQAKSREWVRRLRVQIEGLIASQIELLYPSEFWEAVANLVSAHIRSTEARIAMNREEARAALESDPPPAPIAALRIITRGLDRIAIEQHAALVELYYFVMAQAWSNDPDTASMGAAIETADDLDAFFARVRGA